MRALWIPRTTFALALSAALLSSCSAPTRVHVFITVGDVVLERMSSVRIRVAGGVAPEASEVVESRAIADLDWPAEAIIVPQDGDASRPLRIEVEAVGPSGQTVARIGVSTTFVAGETRILWLHIDDECLDLSSCEITSPCAERDCADAGASAAKDAATSTMPPRDAGLRDRPTCEPRPEACEGAIDEDCDGRVDEGCECTDGVRRACMGGRDEGECAAGTQTCANGRWGACEGRTEPTGEDCNGRDDDCDARTDEDLRRACGRDDRCVQRCEHGEWGSCGGRCDDDDDDHDHHDDDDHEDDDD